MPWEEPKSEIATLVENIPEGIFMQKFVRELGQTRLVGDIVSRGASMASLKDKCTIRQELVKLGIPFYVTDTDAKLDEVLAELFSRSTTM